MKKKPVQKNQKMIFVLGQQMVQNNCVNISCASITEFNILLERVKYQQEIFGQKVQLELNHELIMDVLESRLNSVPPILESLPSWGKKQLFIQKQGFLYTRVLSHFGQIHRWQCWHGVESCCIFYYVQTVQTGLNGCLGRRSLYSLAQHCLLDDVPQFFRSTCISTLSCPVVLLVFGYVGLGLIHSACLSLE